jgi:hypothetical protein
MKRYQHSPKHPDVVAGLNDAAALRGLVDTLGDKLDALSHFVARDTVIDAMASLNATIKDLTP